MTLSYLRADDHKQAVTNIQELWWFELMYTQQGKPDQHATRIPYSVHIWFHTIRISRGQHIATFHVVVNIFEQIHCPREEGLLTQPPARRLTGPWVHTQLLSHNNQWGSGEKTRFFWQPTTRLIGFISPACDQYVQYLLTGGNPSVLNWHRWGLQPWRCRLSTSHSRPSQPTVLYFPPKGPTRSQVIYSQHKPQVKVMCVTYRWPVVFWPLDVYRSLYLRLAMANVSKL
jgi:hypothetical protein